MAAVYQEVDTFMAAGAEVADTESLVETQVAGNARSARIAGRSSLAAFGSAFRGKRAVLMASVLAISACAALLLKRSSCVPRVGPSSMISLVETDKEDLLRLPTNDTEALGRALADSHAEQEDAKPSHAGHKEAAEAVKRALASGNKTKTAEAVESAMTHATKNWQNKRRALKAKLAKNSSSTRGLRKLPFPKIRIPGARSPSEKANVASCVFDVTQTVSQIAALAANINDAARTCKNVVPGKEFGEFEQKTCAVNVESIFFSAASIASTLSMAANNCAETFQPNLDALCSASIASMIQSVSQLAVSSQLIAASCASGEQETLIPGITPSNLGSTFLTPARRMAAENETHAEARRLLLGGGKGSTGAFCAVDITSALWYLAEAGLAINAAANKNAGQSCPPRIFYDGKPTIKEHMRSKAFCAADVAGAIYGFLQAIYFLYFSAVHCLDMLDPAALCGAGVSGLMASLSGVAYSGTSMWLACEELRNEWPMPGRGSPLTKDMLQENVLGQSGGAGRRLTVEDAEGGVAQLKEKFASVEEAFQSLGFDLDDKGAEYRKAEVQAPSPKDVVELLQEPADSAAHRQQGSLGEPLCE